MKRTPGLAFGLLAEAYPGRTIAAAAAVVALVANCPVIVAEGAPWARGLELLAARWFFSCGIGFCAWRLTRKLPVSLALAASAQFIGFFTPGANPQGVVALCWSPWILYCWLRVVDGGSLRSWLPWIAVLLGVNLAELGAGAPQESFALLLGMNFSGACVLLLGARPLREKCRLLSGLAAAGAIFIAIGSEAWPSLFRALGRSGALQAVRPAFQLQPGLFAGLFDGALYKPFQVFPDGMNPSSNFFILIGLLWCVVRCRTVFSDRRAAALAVSSLPALMLVFGVVPSEVIGRTPYLGRIIGVDEAFAPVLVVNVAVLAAFGWKEAWQRLGSPEGKREGAAVWVLLVAVYASYLGTAQAIVRSAYAGLTWGEFVRVGSFVHVYGISLVVAAALLLWAMHRSLRRRAMGVVAVAAAALALAALHWHLAPRLGSVAPAYAMVPVGPVDPGVRP